MSRLLDVANLSVGIKNADGVADILRGVSFHVDRGETLGLVGESGSGKSTTGLSLLRLTPKSTQPYTRGSISFAGKDILQMDERQVRELRGRYISMILQDPMTSLNPVLTIGDQIAEAIQVHNRENKLNLKQRVLNALKGVRIPDPEQRAKAWPHQLSGGMKQRAVGAIAMSCHPELLIADEPTTALDVTVQAQYLDLLKDLQQQLNMALIFITHDFGVVARMCDRVCVMYAGSIVETAPVEAVFENPAHWYTSMLIASMPSIEEKTERLTTIAGSPPKPDEHIQGCRFAPRCPNAQAKCHQEEPMAQIIAPKHEVSCWFPRQSMSSTEESTHD